MVFVIIAKITTQITILVPMPIKVPIIAPANQPVENRGIQTKKRHYKSALSQQKSPHISTQGPFINDYGFKN